MWIIHFFAEYLTFADVDIDSNGIKKLRCNNELFGEYYIDWRTREKFWACTKMVYDSLLKKKRPCRACIKTKVIDGYEMIRYPNVKHDHWKTETHPPTLIF